MLPLRSIEQLSSKICHVGRFQYVVLLLGCLALTAPLELLLHAHVYRNPLRLARTLVVPVVLFYAWDAIAIRRNVWSFAERYTTGWLLPLHVPLEELIFFIVIPICALLTFEAVEWLEGRRHA